jgi:hypothetical protein
MVESTPPRKEVFKRLGTTAKDRPATVFDRLGNGNRGRSVGDAPSTKPAVLDRLGSRKPALEHLEGRRTILERLGSKRPVFKRLKEKPQIAYRLGEKTSVFEQIEFICVVQEGDMLDGQPESSRSRKQRINERIHQIGYASKNSPCPPNVPDLTISLADYEQTEEPHNSPLLVTLELGRFQVKRCLIDIGAFTNVLYKTCFEAMGLSKEHLTPPGSTLYGFAGAGTLPMGTIRLPIAFGQGDKARRIKTDFIVLNAPSAYNALIGHAALSEAHAAVSIRALTLVYISDQGKAEKLAADPDPSKNYSTMKKPKEERANSTMEE